MVIGAASNFFKKNFYLKDRVILTNLAVSLLIIAVLTGAFYFNLRKAGGQEILLHYNIYFGIDWIGKKYWIFIYPLAGALFFIIDLILSIYLYNREKFLSYLLIFSLTFSEILIFIAGLAVAWINF